MPLKRPEKSHSLFHLENCVYLFVFLFMLACNLLTPFIVDDYQYLYSFYDQTRLTSLWDIFPSLWAHASQMNGRLVTHFFVQLFALLPTWVFDIVNSGLYTLLVYLICHMESREHRINPLLTLSIACGIWVFEPVFGQVNLWQDGAVNYLWSLLFALWFLRPFVRAFFQEDYEVSGKWFRFLLAFCAGAYSETVSAAVIFMASILVALRWLFCNSKPKKLHILLILTAFAGYISIYLAPAQWMNKSVEVSASGLKDSIFEAVTIYKSFLPLLIALLVLLIYNLAANTDKKKLLLAGTFLAGSLASNFIMIFARYYAPRSAAGACILLLCAVATLAEPMLHSWKREPFISSVLTVFCLYALTTVPDGFLDIQDSYRKLQNSAACIQELKAQGQTRLEVSVVKAATPYSAIYELKYLDTETPDTWPNVAMAQYYGVESIIGISADSPSQN